MCKRGAFISLELNLQGFPKARSSYFMHYNFCHDRNFMYTSNFQKILIVSIYTNNDLGDLSNLIGSLSRTIQQNSPPSEWIMYELAVFFRE